MYVFLLFPSSFAILFRRKRVPDGLLFLCLYHSANQLGLTGNRASISMDEPGLLSLVKNSAIALPEASTNEAEAI